MAKRVDLQNILESVANTNHVYFQPPESVKMEYPAVVYSLDSIERRSADSMAYTLNHRYSVTYITRNPDDPIVDKIAFMNNCRFDRHYTSNNLHHFTYTIYY